jgi:hypothetical protein
MHGDATHPDVRRQRPNISLALRFAEIAHGRQGILWDHPLDLGDLGGPADRQDVVGRVVVSIVSATRSPLCRALSLGAPGSVPITMSVPSQWNQMDTTRGVPSFQV